MSTTEKLVTVASIGFALGLLLAAIIVVLALTRRSKVCGDFVIDHGHTYECALPRDHRGKHADVTHGDYTDPIDKVWHTWANEHERDYGPFEGADGVPR